MRISEVTYVIYLETCFHICPNHSLKAQKCGPENMSKCLVKTLFTLDIKYQIQLKICIQSSFRHGVRMLLGTENIEPSCLHVQHNFTFHVHGCNTQTTVWQFTLLHSLARRCFHKRSKSTHTPTFYGTVGLHVKKVIM